MKKPKIIRCPYCGGTAILRDASFVYGTHSHGGQVYVCSHYPSRNISRRYRDFISILIMSLIAKRFEKNEPPYTAAQISEEHQIPIRLTNQVLYQLQEIDLIHEVVTDAKSEEIGYQPSMDINQLNVAILLDRLDTYGSENFKIDKDEEFSDEWKVLTESKEEYYKKASKVLLKDL